MTFQNIWQTLCGKKPKLNDPESIVEFESKNLKTLLEQVYDKGFKHGRESIPSSGGMDFDSLFGGWGKK
jgi:hypothetical protein